MKESAGEQNDFLPDRRGVVSHEETFKLADATGLTPADVEKRKVGEAWNAHQIVALRDLVRLTGEDLAEAGRAVNDAPTPENVGEYILRRERAKMTLDMLLRQYAGVTAEAGRSLNIIGSTKMAMRDAGLMRQVLDENFGETYEQVIRQAKAVSELETAGQANKFILDTEKASLSKRITLGVLEYWQNNLISGLATHTTYLVANQLVAVSRVVETYAAGVFHDLTGAEQRVYRQEASARAMGIAAGFPEGLAAGVKALRSGILEPLGGETPAQARNLAFFATRRAIPDPVIMGITVPLGTLVNVPSRMVTALHAYSRTMFYSEEIYALSTRQAMSEGLEGQALAARIAELRQNPTFEMMRDATEGANQSTMMGKGGELTRKVQAMLNADIAGVGPLLRFASPFVKVGTNIVEQGPIQRSVFGPIASPEIRANLAGRNGEIAQATQVGRIAIASGVAAGAMGLYAAGNMTGTAPHDPRQRAIFLAQHPENSIKVLGNWYSYDRMGPIGMVMKMYANIGQAIEGGHDATEMVANAIFGVSHAVMDESWMRSIAQAFTAVTGSDPHAREQWLKGFLSSLVVPYSSAFYQTSRAIDPYQRRVEGLWQAIQNKIPFVSQGLEPQISVWGQPVSSREALLMSGTNAIYTREEARDPLVNALAKLDWFPGLPRRDVQGVRLTPDQYTDYAMIRGQHLRRLMDATIGAPTFNVMLPGQQLQILQKRVAEADKQALVYMQMKYPGLITQAYQNKMELLQTGHRPTQH
jgi:hypothetical protein